MTTSKTVAIAQEPSLFHLQAERSRGKEELKKKGGRGVKNVETQENLI